MDRRTETYRDKSIAVTALDRGDGQWGWEYRIDGAESVCDPVLLAHIRFARLIVGAMSNAGQ